MTFNIIVLIILLSAIILGKNLAITSSVYFSFDSNLHKYISDKTKSDNGSSHSVAKRDLLDTHYSDAVEYAQSLYNFLQRYEINLVNSKIVPNKNTPIHKAILFSRADNIALNLAKSAYINNRESLYILRNRCTKFGKSEPNCAAELKKIPKVLENSTNNCTINNNYRTFDGKCNNYKHYSWGSAYTSYARLIQARYKDGIWKISPYFTQVPNSLDIGKAISKFTYGNSDEKYTLALASWTNLVSYDMAHTVAYRMMHTESDVICCTEHNFKLAPRYRHPLCLPLLDKDQNCVSYVRSMLSIPNNQQYGPAQQMNSVTHFLDGSTIYGSTEEIAKNLREMCGNGGKLKILEENCEFGNPCLLTGDVRPNMDPIGSTIHLVLMREHNRIAHILSQINPHWKDEILYQEARRIVIAEIQHITFKEWLPLIIGENIPKVKYNVNEKPEVYNSFANAAMEFVLTLINGNISLLDEKRNTKMNIPMRYYFVSSMMFYNQEMVDLLIRSLATQNLEGNDLKFSESVTKYFYSNDKKNGLNAISLIIQRGRDHGLPSYVQFRKLFGLKFKSFEDLSGDIPEQTLQLLKSIYQDVEAIDLFVGGMSELPKKGLVGPTFSNIIRQQMISIKAGDRFFYDNYQQDYPFTSEQLNEIRKATIARLLCDNGGYIIKMQSKAFQIINETSNKLVSCEDETDINKVNLLFWKD